MAFLLYNMWTAPYDITVSNPRVGIDVVRRPCSDFDMLRLLTNYYYYYYYFIIIYLFFYIFNTLGSKDPEG